MAWIESHQSLGDHPKTLKLAKLLSIEIPHAMGLVHCLWHWALDYAQDGDLTDFDSDDIALATKWHGDSQLLQTSLLNCGVGSRAGFLELTKRKRLVIHDWPEYAGKLIDKRRSDAARKKASRAKDVPRTSHGRPADGAGTVPNQHNLPNTTEPNQPKDHVSEEDRRLSQLLLDLIHERDPKYSPKAFEKWPNAIRLLHAKDKRDYDEIEQVMRWCQADQFWQRNILSTEKFRDKFSQLYQGMKGGSNGASSGRGDSSRISARGNGSDYAALIDS